MGNDPNLPTNDPPIAPVNTPAPKPSTLITCQFCECHLTPTGDCFRMSDRAKAINKQEQEIEDLNEQLGEERSNVSRLEGELATARAEIKRLSEPGDKKAFWEG